MWKALCGKKSARFLLWKAANSATKFSTSQSLASCGFAALFHKKSA
jgi:hypothetical protein